MKLESVKEASESLLVAGLTDVVAIAAGGLHSLALKSDGTVWAWGHNRGRQTGHSDPAGQGHPTQVRGLGDVVKIAGGGYHSLAVRRDGTVWAWGWHYYSVADAESGERREVRDGAVPVRVRELSGAVDVAGGVFYSLVLLSDGTVWAWGNNQHGQLGDGTTEFRDVPVRVRGLADATAVAAGESCSLALRAEAVSEEGQGRAPRPGDPARPAQ